MRVLCSTGALYTGFKALLPTVLLLTSAKAQVATNYTFTQAAGTFTPITGGTLLDQAIFLLFADIQTFNDNVSPAQTIPAFNYNGTVYTQMYVSNNGFITFGSAPSGTNYTPLSSTETYAGAISALGCNIHNTTNAITSTRDVRWQTVGNEVVVQWRGVRRLNVASEGFAFQIRLNTSNGQIRMVYGPFNAGPGTNTAIIPQVGLRGPNNTFATNVNNRLVGTGAETWSTSLPGVDNASNLRLTSTAPAKSWTSGLTYTFTPNCTQPAATGTVIQDCTTGTYTVQVNVTSLGSAANVDLSSSVGGVFANDVGTGTYATAPVAMGTPSTITVVHNGNSICNLPLGAFNATCTSPTATTSTSVDCAAGTYTVQVNVTGLGSAASVDLTSTVGGLFANDVGIGTYTSPPVPIGTSSSITMVHGCNPSCNVGLGPFNPTGNCVTNGACLTPTLTIPTNGCGSNNNLNANIPITFPGTALGNDVLLESVDLIIQATLLNNSDFEVRLVSPSGQSRNLVINRFGNGLNIGNPSTCPTTFLRLIDGGTPLTNSNISNVTGNYAPEQTLAGFTGNPNGSWTLRLCDEGALLSGALKFVRLNFVIRGSSDPCDPRIIACGQARTPNSTAGYPNTLPPSACAFNGAASTSGVHWWGYTAVTSGEATVSLCGTASFNTRVSVFQATPDCNNLTCVAMSDDAPGCPGNSSDVRFLASAGQSYRIAVHGSGSLNGTYTIALDCQPACTPSVANDLCPTATAMSSVLADGLTPPLDQDNNCAHVDGPTGASGTAPVVGLWYSFNAGTHARHRLRLITHSTIPSYSATVMGYALYSGTCSGLGATSELVSTNVAAQFTDLPPLTPGADYRLLVYNNGSLSQAGSFAMLVDHPGMHDAGVTAVSSPTGTLCGTMISPVVTLKNFGEADLSSVILRVTIDGGGSVLDHPWTGTLAFGASTTVSLPAIPTPLGLHALHVTAVSPNGQADEIAVNDQSTTNYDASGQMAKVVIHTDGAGADITWAIYDSFFFPLVSGGPYGNNTTYESTHCLATTLGDCYTFFLFDSSGDGLCCGNGNGFWMIRDGADRLLLGDQFLASVDGTQSPSVNPLSPLYIGHEFCLPGGPSNIVANECGIFNNTLDNKVYCTAVLGVTSYQFEFSDPDAGFLRRIAVPRPWVKFGEMVTVPLQPGVRYFTRVRVDQGANGFADDRFGGGCEMGIDPEQVPGCTQLIDDPSLSTHSCGVTRAFGGSDKIWAQPVLGGTAYRFKFSNPGEGYNRIIQRTNYVCVLNWVTQPLVNGQYEVTVEVLVNGQWSGYCGAACTLTILNPPGMEQEGRSMSTGGRDGIILYPNPVEGDRFTIRIDGLVDEHQEVLVEVFATNGQRLAFQRYVNEGDLFSRAIELPPSMAAGTCVVRVNVNGKVSSHELGVVR